MIKKISLTILFAISLAFASQPSMAVTIGFGTTAGNFTSYDENGFTIDIARIINGQCLPDSCMGLNTNETSTLSQIGGGAFTLDSFWFYLAGTPAELTATAYSDATPIATFVFDTSIFAKNVGHVFSTPIADITSIVFTDSGTGNVRIDDINLLIANADVPLGHTPLPAALPLFATGLGALGLLGWRRKRKAAALAVA